MRIVIEHLLGILYKLIIMGMEVEKCSTLLGGNNSVILNKQFPSSALKKNHNLVAFHKTREAVAALFVQTGHIKGNQNTCDILTKSLSPIDFYNLTGSILYNQFPKDGDIL